MGELLAPPVGPDITKATVGPPPRRWGEELFALRAPDIRTDLIPRWNRTNYLELLDWQRAEDEGCFFFGLYGLSAARYPYRPLPPADEYLESLRPMYGQVLEDRRLMVRHNMLEEALGIYPEWGINLIRFSFNNQGERVFGRHLSPERTPIVHVPSREPLETDGLPYPYSVLVHQAGGNNTHFMTCDGTEEAKLIAGEYFQRGYKVTGLLEFMRWGWLGGGEGPLPTHLMVRCQITGGEGAKSCGTPASRPSRAVRQRR